MALSACLVWIGILVAVGLIFNRLISKPSRKTSKPKLPPENPYEAPFNGIGMDLERFEYQQYVVTLRPHYSLEQHKKKVGFLTEKHILYVVDPVFYRMDYIAYFAGEIDDQKLAILRSDPGVERVGVVGKIIMH